MSNPLINPFAGAIPEPYTTTSQMSTGTTTVNPLSNAGGTNYFTPQYNFPSVSDIEVDLRTRIYTLERQLLDKETALREAYMEIGRLHETLRGLTGFKAWSEQVAQTKQP
jgi:hypothetical protein